MSLDDGHECPFDEAGIKATEYTGDANFAAIYNLAPIVPGHSMVLPRSHVERLLGLDEEKLLGLFAFARRVSVFLAKQFNAEGFNWTIQDGEAAGQTVPHVHLHIIPRYRNDLPTPGEWYQKLEMPAIEPVHDADDSRIRARLSPHEMERVVKQLSTAAESFGFEALGQPSRGFTTF